MAEAPVQGAGRSIESNGLIRQVVVRRPLHFDRKVIPGIAVRKTRNTRWDPLPLLIIKDIPLVPVGYPALVTINETHALEELIDVELQSLGQVEIISIEIHVVSEIEYR